MQNFYVEDKEKRTFLKKGKRIISSDEVTSKKKVVEEEEVKKEEVIVTRPSISKNEVKALKLMTKEVEVTSEPSNLPIQLKYILRYAERCPLQVGTVECGYYVMRYMHEIVSNDTNIITDAIDRRNSYSQLELDEIRVEWAEFLTRHYTYIDEAIGAKG
ncbi:hypothetical protein E6C27_scaffold190G00050 [Cucumis melo var. makuwa]|uniref:Uncharacterized protein n=1 Tax=Cucumis melo var. makuwa TaxID=1194695 RepID=A0A5A7UEI0_CUCMM|nr:hypothetical protein E6C27_scaffold190G00050 [Cucumis melo var. makuwa]